MRSFLLAALSAAAFAETIKLAAVDGQTLRRSSGTTGDVAPSTQTLEPTLPGRERVKIRYGPFNVPANDKSVGLGKFLNQKGVIWNQPVLNVQKPCTDCVVTTFQPGLEYPDGKDANVDTGMWLHHMVIINKGPGRWDATCFNAPMSLPHLDVGATPKSSERLFSSGNERSIFETTLNNTVKAGYYMKATDKFNFIIDLMNQNSDARDMYVTMTYEFLRGAPEGWTSIKPVWLDAATCGTSQVKVPKKDIFVISTKPWVSNFDGQVMGMGGHLHDGGTHAEIYWNGKLACDAKAIYGEKSLMQGGSRKRDMGGGDHISAMTGCLSMKEMKKGDTFVIKGYYDTHKHKMMKGSNGKMEDIMVISIFLARVPIVRD